MGTKGKQTIWNRRSHIASIWKIRIKMQILSSSKVIVSLKWDVNKQVLGKLKKTLKCNSHEAKNKH